MWSNIFTGTLRVSVICVIAAFWISTVSAQTKSSQLETSIEQDQQRILASVESVKISVNQDGLHRISRTQLLPYGIDTLRSSLRLRLFTDGIELPIRIYSDGTLEFFGRKLNTNWSDKRIYWLIPARGVGKRFLPVLTERMSRKVTNSTYTAVTEFREKKNLMTNVINGEAENFFGSIINNVPLEQTLNVSNIASEDAPPMLEVAIQGASSSQHNIRVIFNDVEIGSIQGAYRDHFVKQFPLSLAQLRDGANSVRLSSGASSDVSLADYVRLNYPRTVSPDNGKLNFTLAANKSIKINGFNAGNFRVFDITDPSNYKELSLQQRVNYDGSFAYIIPAISTERTIWAQLETAFQPVEIFPNVVNDLQNPANGADFVILTHKNFRSSLEPLRVQRESEGLRTKIVDIEDVFDEFSFGAKNPHAIFNFMHFAKNNWQLAPKYLLLVGDSTLDAKNYLGTSQEDFMTALPTDYLFGEASSDDSLTDFDQDGIADIPTGRLSVRTVSEANLVVGKILTYGNLAADFTATHGSTFVNDTPTDYDFAAMTSDIQSVLPTNFERQTINRNAGTTTEIRTQILNSVNQGKGIVNYLGHGTLTSWTGASLFRVTDTPTLTNGSNLSIFVALSCANGAFAESNESLAEGLQRAPNGGAVATLASSGSVYPFGLILMSKDFYQKILNRPNIRIGDALQESKATMDDLDIRRLVTLFGDPTMRIKNGR